MKQLLQRLAGRILHLTRMEYFPVTVRSGLPAGARWTLYPWTSYWRGGYEPAVEAAIKELGDLTGKVCWDLGAHYGFYSIAFAMRTGPTGQVAAFEPFPESFARLQRHREMNQLSWLRLFPAAVSNEASETDFVMNVGGTTNHLPYDGEVLTASTSAMRVRTVRLDDLVESGEVRPPDLIKVDVEGHGHRALHGAIRTITAQRPVLLMGFHSPQEVAGTESLLGPLGYQFAPVDPLRNPVGRIGADYLLRPR